MGRVPSALNDECGMANDEARAAARRRDFMRVKFNGEGDGIFRRDVRREPAVACVRHGLWEKFFA